MNHKTRFVSFALCAALLVGLLAGCSSTTSSSAAASSSVAPASESVSASSAPSETSGSLSTTEASAPSLTPKKLEENTLYTISGTDDAFQPCLGWGPGVSGSSLKSVLAAVSLLDWAESSGLSQCSKASIENAFNEWYNALSSTEQEGFAEAWPMIQEDAASLLDDRASMSDALSDAGVEESALTDWNADNWQALEDAIDPLIPEAAGEF